MKLNQTDRSLSSSKISNLPYSDTCLESLIENELTNKKEFILLNCQNRQTFSPIVSLTSSSKYNPKRASHCQKNRKNRKNYPFTIDYFPQNKTKFTTNEIKLDEVNNFQFVNNPKIYHNDFLSISSENNFELNNDKMFHTLPVYEIEKEDTMSLSYNYTGRSTKATEYNLKSNNTRKDDEIKIEHNSPATCSNKKKTKNYTKFIKNGKTNKLSNNNHYICKKLDTFAKDFNKDTNNNNNLLCNFAYMNSHAKYCKTNRNKKKIYTNINSTLSENRNTFLKKHSIIYHTLNQRD